MNSESDWEGTAKDTDAGKDKELGPLMQSVYLAHVTKMAWGRCTFNDCRVSSDPGCQVMSLGLISYYLKFGFAFLCISFTSREAISTSEAPSQKQF